MNHRTHRHDHRGSIGAVLLKLGLHIAGALVKRKLAERAAAKRAPGSFPPRRT